MDDLSEAKRIRVAWDRGINHLASFYAMLDTKRKEIGDEALRDYCFFELKISLSIIMRISEVLEESDKERVREELARVAEIDKEKKRQERAAKKEREHAERLAQANRKVEMARELNAVLEQDKKVKEKTVSIKARSDATVKRGRGRPPNPVIGGPQSDPNIIAALNVVLGFAKRVAELRQKWVEASLVLAAKLYEGRNTYLADGEFGKWINANQLRKLSAPDRAVLIDMGADLEVARKAFDDAPDSVSWRGIWGSRFNNAVKPDFSEQNQEDRPSIH